MASTAQELFEELDELRDRNGNAANGSTDPDDQLDEDELS